MIEKFALIGGDIHKLIRMKKNDSFCDYPWRIHYEGDLYFVPVKDESKNGFVASTFPYKRKRIFNNYECI